MTDIDETDEASDDTMAPSPEFAPDAALEALDTSQRL